MDIIGHKKILHRLERSISRHSVSHAYLFSGPEGVGKFAVALSFARNLVENRAEWENSMDVSQEMLHADIRVVAPEVEEKNGVVKKKEIKVEAVKDLQHWLILSARGSYKVAIVNDADWLNKTAQNALLKTLEEMPKGTVMILVAQDEWMLLPTVVSRCQVCRFGTVSPEELDQCIERVSKNKELAGEVAFWSLRRPGLAITLVNNSAELNLRREARRKLEEMLLNNVVEKLFFAEELSKDESITMKTLNYWAIIFREIIQGRSRSFNLSSHKAFYLMGHIIKSLEDIKGTNANMRLVLENLFLHF